MEFQNHEKTHSSGSLASGLCVIGPKRLQNEMVARCLGLATGAKCQVVCDISQIHALAPLKTKDEQSLIVLDCQEKDPHELLAELKSCLKHKLSRHIVALYNVSEDIEIEESCLFDGIRGLFYEQDSFELFTKGVQAILDGKLWFPREMMERWLLEGAERRSLPSREKIALKAKGTEILTKRETEILTMVAVGNTNDEIADKLSISLKTVKAHLYSAFKKLNVSNRLQATLWTAENL